MIDYSILAHQLHGTFKTRIVERRQHVVVALLMNQDSINKVDPVTGAKVVSKNSVINMTNSFSQRLLILNADNSKSQLLTDSTDTHLTTDTPMSMKE